MKKAMHDADAIRRCREGEVEAFHHLVQGYQRRALAHARALTGNDADAADSRPERVSRRVPALAAV